MKITNICKTINCPFYKEKTLSCERYTVSDHCHLMKEIPDIRSNQYYLSIGMIEDETEISNKEVELYKQINEDFFKNDQYYKDYLKFIEIYPDLNDKINQ